jgi:hypothetical protein
LRPFLRNTYPAEIGGRALPACDFELVSAGQLASDSEERNRITLFLYRLSVNEHSRQSAHLRASESRLAPLGLDLHYLMSSWGMTPQDEQVALTWALRQLHEFPVLDASSLTPDAGWASDEVIQIVPSELATEDVMRIWDALSRLRIGCRCPTSPDWYVSTRTATTRSSVRWSAGALPSARRRRERRPSVSLHELERLEWRVLGALRPVDGTTGMALRGALEASAAGARIARNRSGLYVIHEWSRLPRTPPLSRRHRRCLYPAASVRDHAARPAGRYLPRLATIALPRDPQAVGADLQLCFTAVDVPLYPSAAAGLGSNWTAVRASITDNADGAALGGALLRVVAGAAVLARGMSDWRGEALVPVVGVPVTTWSEDEDAVVVSSIAATVEVYFDPALGTRTPIVDVRAGRQPAATPLVDPATSKPVARRCRRRSRTSASPRGAP